jgi:hypothetical protein
MTDNVKIATSPNSMFAVRFVHLNAFGASQRPKPLGSLSTRNHYLLTYLILIDL